MKNRPFCRRLILIVLILISVAFFTLLGAPIAAQAERLRQQPTVSIPTVTGTPLGPTAVVNGDQNMINVHTGPGQNYPIIGVLVANQKAPATGIDREGQWVQIVYMGVSGNIGWVSASLVTLDKTPPEVAAPPLPEPRSTPTLEPTLAARYMQVEAPTRLPTFTPAAPLIVPTYTTANRALDVTRLPVGFIIIGLGVIGLFGTVLSLLRRS